MRKSIRSDDEIATDKLSAREWYLKNKEVPSITDMRRELGVDLANVLISNFDATSKKLMLIRDDDSPIKIKMHIPVVPTHQYIMDNGERIERQIINQMLNDTMYEELIKLKHEFCDELERQENDLNMEYDQLKQEVLRNMQEIFEDDEADLITLCNNQRRETAQIIEQVFNEIKPLMFSAIETRIRKEAMKEHERFIKQRLHEQHEVYSRMRASIATEFRARNQKYMLRILNEYASSLSDQIQSVRSVNLINNLHLITKERLRHQTRIEKCKAKLDAKLREMILKCEKIINKPLKCKSTCSNVDLWKQKCLVLIDSYEKFIEDSVDEKEYHGRFFLDRDRLMQNFESIDRHDHGFYECNYESGGINEYEEMVNAVTAAQMPKLSKSISEEPIIAPSKICKDETEAILNTKGCWMGKQKIENPTPTAKSDTSLPFIQYHDKIYASNKYYDKIANQLIRNAPKMSNDEKSPFSARFHLENASYFSSDDDDMGNDDNVAETAANFRIELLKSLNLNGIAKEIFNIIMESALTVSVPSIQGRCEESILIPLVMSANMSDLRQDSSYFLTEVEEVFKTCIDRIATPIAIIELIKKIQKAQLVKRKRLLRARDSVTLTKRKFKQQRLRQSVIVPKKKDVEKLNVNADEINEEDLEYNPPMFFHANSLNFHYDFDAFFDKIMRLTTDDLVEIPKDLMNSLKHSMQSKVLFTLSFADEVKYHLRNTRILKRFAQRLKQINHGILKPINHFKTNENIKEFISILNFDNFVELLARGNFIN